MRFLLPLLALLALPAAGCSPCADYCEEQCACDGHLDGQEADADCVDGCLETLDVYSPDVRDEECSARLDELQEECR